MSLRVAGKIAPAIVVTFAKGMTLGCMFRLVWHDFAEQRGSRMKCQQTLVVEIASSRPCSVMMPNLLMQVRFDLPSLQAQDLFHRH